MVALGPWGFEGDVIAADIAFAAQDRINEVVAGVRLVHAHAAAPFRPVSNLGPNAAVIDGLGIEVLV
jgi:hypothetical protein